MIDSLVCAKCKHTLLDHAAENDACPIKLTYIHGGNSNTFHTVNKFTKQTATKIVEQSTECPCGIFRIMCDYHK